MVWSVVPAETGQGRTTTALRQSSTTSMHRPKVVAQPIVRMLAFEGSGQRSGRRLFLAVAG
jgi:hypothetical protein